MPSRDALESAVHVLREQWPSIGKTVAAVDGYATVLTGYTDDELRGGLTLVLREHDGMASPKPATLAKACARIAKVRRAQVVDDGGPEWYCPHCHTRSLVWLEHEGFRPRLIPDCRDGCSQRDAWWPRPPVRMPSRPAAPSHQ